MSNGTVKWFNSRKGFGFITNSAQARMYSFISPALQLMALNLWTMVRV